jgi:hypothetical protein
LLSNMRLGTVSLLIYACTTTPLVGFILLICPASDGIGKSQAEGKLVEARRISLDERQQPTLF